MRDVYRIKSDRAIDADGHILERPDLWERYLEPKYRDRALRIKVDSDGLEYLEIGGQASLMSRKGFPGTLGAMGKMNVEDVRPSPERAYLAGAPHGSMDMKERLERLDAERLEAAVLCPTIGILWEVARPARADRAPVTRRSGRRRARARARSDRRLPRRVRGAVHVEPHAPRSQRPRPRVRRRAGPRRAARAAPVVRATRDGVDPLHPAAQDAPLELGDRRRRREACVNDLLRLRRVRPLPEVPARRARVRRRLYEATFIGERVPLEEKPSHYFKTRCFISADPDERTIPSLVERLGADRFFWASDFPHADHTASYAKEVEELAGLLKPDARARFLGDNARELYRIGA